ncbi:hypothetical protein GQ43DRAFT_347891, partial [Delitschia confertaspora ATCC 74209]
ATESFNEPSGFDDIPLAAPPSALTSRPTHYDPHDPSSPPLDAYTPSGHQRSLTGSFFENCRPLVNRATSTLQQHTSKASFHSPTKSLASFIPSRNTLESTASQPKIRAGAKVLSGWFNGSSAPVALGVGTHTEEDSDSGSEDYDSEDGETGNTMAGIFTRASALTRSATAATINDTPQVPPKPTHAPPASSKFAWLLNTQKSSSASAPQSQPSPTYHNPSDELLNLNITQALFPYGPVDPLAPSSFHDLLSTAERLLTRYQNSYRTLSTALGDARAEQSAQDDELDEAETRVRHLKMQLETMAARATEQDAQMQQLKGELAIERHRRKDEEEARKNSLALIRGPACAHLPSGLRVKSLETPMRRKRVSNSEVSVDSGFESECDSEAASIFSRANGALSPTDTVPSSVASEMEMTPSPMEKRPMPLQRTSTYEKVLRKSVDFEGGWGCGNCEGGVQSSVWGRLAREREENSQLKRRVQVLEDAVHGALDVVDGPWGL